MHCQRPPGCWDEAAGMAAEGRGRLGGYLPPCTGQMCPPSAGVRAGSGVDAHADAFRASLHLRPAAFGMPAVPGQHLHPGLAGQGKFGDICETTEGQIQPWLVVGLTICLIPYVLSFSIPRWMLSFSFPPGKLESFILFQPCEPHKPQSSRSF